MKKTKLTEKPSRVTSPFDTSSHKTERTANQKLVEWIKIDYEPIYRTDFIDQIAFPDNRAVVEEIKELKTLSGKKFSIPYPRVVDCIIGNLPYTRQEEITGKEGYKDSMINKALLEGKRKLADISKRAGIHAYFFVRGELFV